MTIPIYRRSTLIRLVAGGLGWLLPLTLPATAADRVYVTYSILERSIPVASLETYARTGKIDENLDVYAQYAKPAELRQLRNVLLAKAKVDPVAVSQFLYSPQGEGVLKRLGQVIQSESRLPDFDFKALRASLILAASDPAGLTPLNILKKYPTRGIRIDVQRSLALVGALQQVVNATNQATAEIEQLADAAASTEGNLVGSLTSDLRLRGPYAVSQSSSFQLNDIRRQRQFPVDLYLPQARQRPLRLPLPVVVISHGLGSDRTTFRYLANHLASYGFAVLVPEHPGSNANQLEALISGRASEVAEPAEFLNRPLDVTYLLNEMERLSAGNPELQQLNLKQVGVVGQSFGGYTALALAGAPLNVEQLDRRCQSVDSPTDLTNNLIDSLNISLLLQCRALPVVSQVTSLRDPRIKATIAINPITSAVFGEASLDQITIPTMVVAGSADTIAPALSEQIQPFTWLTTPDKYLVLLDPGTHFSVLSSEPDSNVVFRIPAGIVGPSPASARRYLNALSVAFFQTYLTNQTGYQAYLSSAYVARLNEGALSASLIRSLTTAQLDQALGDNLDALPSPAPSPTPSPSPSPTPTP